MARNTKVAAERVEQDVVREGAVREVKVGRRVYHTPEVHELGTLAAVHGSYVSGYDNGWTRYFDHFC